MERVEIQEAKTIGSEDFNLGNEIFKNDYFLEITRAVKSTLGPSGMEKFLQKKKITANLLFYHIFNIVHNYSLICIFYVIYVFHNFNR